MDKLPILATQNLCLKLPSVDAAASVRDYFYRNRQHLAPTMPIFDDELFQVEFWKTKLAANIDEFRDGRALRLFLFHASDTNHVIGSCNFTEIIRGVYQGCFLGYGIDEKFQSQGLMTEALGEAIKFVFGPMNLHKIDANYLPSNTASGRVLNKLGFEKMGLARQELYLTGEWRDHVAMRLINVDWAPTP